MLTRARTTSETEFFKLPYSGRLFTPNYVPFNRLYHSSTLGEYSAKIIMKKSVHFQNVVLNTIESRLRHHIPRMSQTYYEEDIRKHSKGLKKKLDSQPVMSHVPISNSTFRTYGVLTLVVRNDYLDKVFPKNVSSKLQNLHLPPSEYTPVFITYSTIPLKSDGLFVNMNENVENHIFKLYMCKDQFKSEYGILIGRQYRWKGKLYTNALENVGVIRFDDVDPKDIRNKLNGRTEENEYTLMGCNTEHFERLRMQGITSIDDPRCTAAAMGITDKRAPIIDAIIQTQQGNELIRPSSFTFPTTNKRRLYVDFETITSLFNDNVDDIECRRHDYVFMIGIGEEIDGKWVYKKIQMTGLTLNEERSVLNAFFEELQKEPCVVYHWYNAEPRFLQEACKRHSIAVPEIDWMDLYLYFKSVPITIKGSFTYSIKSVAKAMYSHGMINTTWNEELVNGNECAAMAYLWYQGQVPYEVMDSITYYNEVDCKVMWEMIQYLEHRNE